MARRRQDEETIEITTAPFEAPQRETPQHNAAGEFGSACETPASDAPQNLQSEPVEIAPPCKAFNLLREKHPDTYPEWSGLSDDERLAFCALFERRDDEDVQGNPYVECAKEVMNNG